MERRYYIRWVKEGRIGEAYTSDYAVAVTIADALTATFNVDLSPDVRHEIQIWDGANRMR